VRAVVRSTRRQLGVAEPLDTEEECRWRSFAACLEKGVLGESQTAGKRLTVT
jgi:hypothetical protein